jgi:DNA polymerase-3 subunit beta
MHPVIGPDPDAIQARKGVPGVRFTVEHSALAPALATVSRVIAARAVRPILSATLIEAADGRLVLAATNLETAVVTTVPAAVEEDGRAAVPARYLAEMMRRIPGGELRWDAPSGTPGARIAWGRSHFAIHGYDPGEYPQIATFPERVDRILTQARLRHAITHTAFAAAQGETARALLTGVELRLSGEALFALATDGFQAAAYATDPDAPRPADGSVVVPAPVLQDVARLLADVEDPCDIVQQGNQILFRAGNTYLVARVLEGKYFAVLDLVPKAFPTVAQVGRDALFGACERVGLICENEPPHAVTVHAADGQIQLSSVSADVGTAEEVVEARISGPDVKMGFNVRQLIEGLRRFEGSEIQIEISGAKSLARFTDPADRRLQFLQMPLQMPE